MTRATWILAILLFLVTGSLLRPAPIYACDSDDNSSSDSSSSDSYDDSNGKPSCVDTTEIVGRAQCRTFGAWDIARMPRLRIALGTSISAFPTVNLSFQGTAEHDTPLPYSLVHNTIGDSDAVATVLDGRITRLLGRHSYVGSAASMGIVTLPGLRAKTVHGMSLNTDVGMYFSLSFLTGASVEIANLVVRGEAHVGRRFIFVPVETRHQDCIDHSTVQAGQWMIRPQLVVEAWLSPRLSAGITASKDALRSRDLAAGVFLQFHTRTFDALRPRS